MTIESFTSLKEYSAKEDSRYWEREHDRRGRYRMPTSLLAKCFNKGRNEIHRQIAEGIYPCMSFKTPSCMTHEECTQCRYYHEHKEARPLNSNR